MEKANIPSAPLQAEDQPRKADKYIWAIYIALIAISVVELYSASSREVQASNVFGPLLRHAMMLLLGFGVTLGLSRMKFKWLIPLTPVFVGFALIIAVYVLFKGQVINGARRSMSLFGIALQSAELLKLAVVLVIAYVVAFNQEKRGVTTTGVSICAAFVLLASGLLFSQGLTNTLLLMGISMAMMLIGGIQLRKFMIVLVCYGAIGGAGALYKSSRDKMSEEEIAYITETGKNFKGETATIDRQATQMGRVKRWLGVGDTIPKYAQPITALNRQEMYSFMAQATGSWPGVLPGTRPPRPLPTRRGGVRQLPLRQWSDPECRWGGGEAEAGE